MNALETAHIDPFKGRAEVSFGDDEGNYIWADVSFDTEVTWCGGEYDIIVTDIAHTVTETEGVGADFDTEAVLQAIYDDFETRYSEYADRLNAVA